MCYLYSYIIGIFNIKINDNYKIILSSSLHLLYLLFIYWVYTLHTRKVKIVHELEWIKTHEYIT